MADNINWEHHLRDFQTQQYPTAKETAINNASTLYKRKKFFLKDIKHSVKFIGFLLLGITYLHDLSMLRLGVRGFVHYTLANPYPTSHLYTEDSKKALSKWLLLSVIGTNSLCFLIHLVFGAYTETRDGTPYLYGGLSIQFIGERLPFGRIELLFYDVILLFCQLILHSLTCFIDSSEVLQVQPVSNEREVEGDDLIEKIHDVQDGYNGNVMLISINLFESIRTVMNYDHSFQLEAYGQFGDTNFPIPGSFASATQSASSEPVPQ